ncbi:hypothetical protein [Aestuariivirga sp.]|uniref:hypothetical protein n=1 Tax=Aestuariivirga sp. TaxID=2650926 RepID=UPI0025B9DD68|nr:hypothetical protein [Aestuariivirga sp.]MCA3554770.1 hypothetical protein [Aestuariivirga sp.]
MRRWLARAVALTLILPTLIAVLPQPALSASAALDRDLLMSGCGEDAPQRPDRLPHQTAHDHCVLCASHCPGCGPSSDNGSPAFAHAPRHSGMPQALAAAALGRPPHALTAANPPRGPPALS